MKKNERLNALHVLTKLLEENTPLTHLMQSATDLSPLSKEICFGVCRHYFRLSALADALLNKRPKTIDIWASLLIGLYQLHFLRIPDYAVVKETVALLDQIKKPWAKGLVNAILRTYCREQETLVASLGNNPAFVYGHPEWFIKRLQKDWPTSWEAILLANDKHPPMSLRVNARHTTVANYLARLEEVNIQGSPLLHGLSGIVLTHPCDVHELPGFSNGDVSVQDEAAQLAASLLDLKPELRVLDACSAPGGKTCHILEKEPLLTRCVSFDIDIKRLARVKENLKRLHLEATVLAGDGLHPETWWDGVLFDRILLDAPCSATGVVRRHPDIKLLREEADIASVTQLQHGLIRALWPLLAPGGRMVYATCSVMPEENEAQISSFIAEHSDCNFLNSTQPWGQSTGHGWQILPGDNNMDGFFYSILIKAT